jgi:hypothetical protein
VKGRRFSGQGVPAGSNRDDDLSELPAGFEIAVCLDNLVEWKHSIDDGLQRAFFQTIENKIHRRLLALRITLTSSPTAIVLTFRPTESTVPTAS